MWITHDFRVARRDRDTAVAIGNFDGVHRGHRSILEHAREDARANGLDTVVLTFEPHPARMLAPQRAPAIVTDIDRKLELLAAEGVACAVVQGFDPAFASQTPEQFAQRVLVGLRARRVYVGADFRFGKDRAGHAAGLVELGSHFGFGVRVVPPVLDEGAAISSTRVRNALAAGDLATCERLLGRPFDFDGVVLRGDQRGRTLGFPTLNLHSPIEALPADGVYAVRVKLFAINGQDSSHHGVMNVGGRPTFAAGRAIEAHLLDFDRDVYGTTVRIECVQRLRGEMAFANADELRAQIARDVASARTILTVNQR